MRGKPLPEHRRAGPSELTERSKGTFQRGGLAGVLWLEVSRLKTIKV